jgi:hypothetical protein
MDFASSEKERIFSGTALSIIGNSRSPASR